MGLTKAIQITGRNGIAREGAMLSTQAVVELISGSIPRYFVVVPMEIVAQRRSQN